jgi:hypothetical protein
MKLNSKPKPIKRKEKNQRRFRSLGFQNEA